MSHPQNCEILEESALRIQIQKIGTDMTKEINIFYRTADMGTPKFLYQTSPDKYPGLVAVMA